MKNILVLAVAAGFLGACSLAAAVDAKPAFTKQNLVGVSAAELPAKAAALVKAEKSKVRPAGTVEIVKTCVSMRPAIIQTVVGAIAEADPEMAPVAAETAAREQTKAAAAIAQAAASAAPKMVGSVVVGVCRAVPADYEKIALAVARVVPNSDKEILLAVAAALPELKPGIEEALAANRDKQPSVANVLTATKDGGTKRLGPPLPPTIAPAYKPAAGPSGFITPAGTDPVPPGGRGYAKP